MSQATREASTLIRWSNIFSWDRVWQLPAIIAGSIVILDQWTKQLVLGSEYLRSGGDIQVIPHLFKLVYVLNTGAAWGIFAGKMIFLAILSAVVFVFVALTYRKLTDGWVERCAAISLIMGGIVGNLIDRLFYPGVVDFILVYYRSYQWPAFNIADSAICVGVGVYLVSSFLRPDTREETKPTSTTAP